MAELDRIGSSTASAGGPSLIDPLNQKDGNSILSQLGLVADTPDDDNYMQTGGMCCGPVDESDLRTVGMQLHM